MYKSLRSAIYESISSGVSSNPFEKYIRHAKTAHNEGSLKDEPANYGHGRNYINPVSRRLIGDRGHVNLDHQDAIGTYTGEGSYRLNQHLIKIYKSIGRPAKPEELHHLFFDSGHDMVRGSVMHQRLQEALEGHPTKRPHTIYSGLGFDMRDYIRGGKGPKQAGGIVYSPAYISGSTSPDEAQKFIQYKREQPDGEDKGHFAVFHVQPGHKAIPIADYSKFPHENEVLLSPGYLTHHGTFPVRGSVGNPHRVTYIHHMSYFSGDKPIIRESTEHPFGIIPKPIHFKYV